ncbi:MAG: hypothetical protein IT405_00065 [Candidatus Yanofskybacteria bacterium]|nr:hypothetical protein [Candidatus Yanofskybacteria bacterium]
MQYTQTKRGIPRPDLSVAHLILFILSQEGRATFRQISKHPQTRLLGSTRSENSFYTALARLKRRRLIARIGDKYELTPAGEYASLKAYVRKELVSSERAKNADAKKNVSWDGRWRIVFFDIPEQKRAVRDHLRLLLRRLGFEEFQRSIWVTPWKLPPFLVKFIADPQLRRYAKVVTTLDVDYDEDLRRRFRLL